MGYPVYIFSPEDVVLTRLIWIRKHIAMTFTIKKEEQLELEFDDG